jgi:glycosyltransferase involved in cell wall biosynthesis
MPAYNVAAYISAAIESVLAQTHRDVDLWITDDGSTDDTAAIVSDYAARDPRVHILRQPNAGISTARNHALRHAQGELLAILDADDVWEPQFLQAQIDLLRTRPDVDIVTGNAWFLGSRLHGRPARPTPDPRPDPDLATILADEYAVFIMSVMRRRVYERIGPFDEGLRTNEDYNYWLRAAAAGFKFARNDRPLAHYRQRDDSLSANDVRMLRGILRVYDNVRPLLADRPRELEILERQYARFDTERLAAEARAAIEARDYRTAGTLLAELSMRRGSRKIRLATWMARFAPSLLSFAYYLRRARMAWA